MSRKTPNLTDAQKIDRAVGAYRKADTDLEAAKVARENAREELHRLARKHGVRDGKTFQLTGRRDFCSVTIRKQFTVFAEDALDLPRKWLRKLTSRSDQRFITPAALELFEDRRGRVKLPKVVQTFLRRIHVTRDVTIRPKGEK